jgi:hypothetical protein
MKTKELFSLGDLYISDFVQKGELTKERYPLSLVMDEDGAVRLPHHIPINKMFGKYWYRSALNGSMKAGLKDIVESIVSIVKPGKKWLDIASNDGTLLSYVPEYYYKIGIDPCEDSFLNEARLNSDLIIQDYFKAELMEGKKADVITSIAMFYDVVDRGQFLEDVYEVLEDDGVWVLQQSYTPLMIQQVAFDNICHEHFYYYSLFNLKKLLERHGFKVMDCQFNEINGGSFRLYVMKDVGNVQRFSSQPYRDVCKVRIDSVLAYEKELKLDEVETWDKFYTDICKLKTDVVNFILTEKAKGKTIYGYGASTKGNTLLQFFGLTSEHITAIADVSEYKHGLYTIATDIPIISEQEMRAAKPDYLLILPWHFISNFIERESLLRSQGTKFIVPCPKLQIL